MKNPGIVIPRCIFIGSVTLLVLFGFLMVSSASNFEGTLTMHDGNYFLVRQLFFVVLGVGFAVVLCLRNYNAWTPTGSWIFWAVVVVLLMICLTADEAILGARREIALPMFTMIPGELVKITILLVCASLFMEYHRNGFNLNWLARFIVVVAVPLILLFLQPDVGTMIFAAIGILAMIWLGGMPARYLLVGVAICALGCLIIVAKDMAEGGYRMVRIMAMLNPSADLTESGYQYLNSSYAFAGGGISGAGLGNSHQKYGYLPEAETDFIFAVIGEELGLIGSVAVVILFAVVVFSGIFIARKAADVRGRMIAGTSAILLGIQAFYNILCVLGMMPITGKALPFISYGGTSMVTSMILVGLILWVSRHASSEKSYARNRENLAVRQGSKQRTNQSAGARVGIPVGAHPGLRIGTRGGSLSGSQIAAGIAALIPNLKRGQTQMSKTQVGKSKTSKTQMGKTQMGKTQPGKKQQQVVYSNNEKSRRPVQPIRMPAKTCATARQASGNSRAAVAAGFDTPRPRRKAEIISLAQIRGNRTGLFNDYASHP